MAFGKVGMQLTLLDFDDAASSWRWVDEAAERQLRVRQLLETLRTTDVLLGVFVRFPPEFTSIPGLTRHKYKSIVPLDVA